jgi:ribosomal protein S1
MIVWIQIVIFEDAKVGEKVTAIVERATSSGIYVKIDDRILGFIPQMHSADKPVELVEKLFKQGKSRIFIFYCI